MKLWRLKMRAGYGIFIQPLPSAFFMSKLEFKDYFSQQADIYSRHRPEYPPALFEYISSVVTRHETAWDCATGNGQAALGLAPYFMRVIATDAESMAYFAFQVAPAAAVAGVGAADRVISSIRRRLLAWWPELGRVPVDISHPSGKQQ